MHHLSFYSGALGKMCVCHLTQYDVQPCKMTDLLFQCVCVAMSLSARILLLLPLPASNHRGSERAPPCPPLLGTAYSGQAAQAPCASEAGWLLPSSGISETVMPRREVSSQMLRLLACS